MGNCQIKRALFTAVQEGDAAAVSALLQRMGPHADLSLTQAPEGNTPLHVAAICGHTEVARLLLRHAGTDIDARDADGRTPLYVAAMGGHIDIVQLLLQPPQTDQTEADGDAAGATEPRAGASVNLHTSAGLNALFAASWRGHRAVVLLLREYGGDLLLRDAEGRHAWTIAREWNHVQLADELEALARAGGWTPQREPPRVSAELVDGPDAAAAADVALDMSAAPTNGAEPTRAQEEILQHQPLPHAHQPPIAAQ